MGLEEDAFFAKINNNSNIQKNQRLETVLRNKFKRKTTRDGVEVTIIGYNVRLGKVIAETNTGEVISGENLGSNTITPGTKGMYQPQSKTIDFTTY